MYDYWGGYHATMYDNAARVSGHTNNAVSLSATNKSYVQLRDGLTSDLNDFTISIWVNYTSKGSRVFDFGESTGVFMILTPGLRYKITCPAGTYDVTATGNTLPTGQWTHLVLTQEGTAFKMYMNGVEILSDNNATVKPSDMGVNTKNYLVKSHWGSDSYSTCLLDELRIYNRALNAGEVNALMNGSVYAAELSDAAITLEVGETHQLAIKSIFPDNADVSTLTWNTEDAGVAGVENGLVTAVSQGNTTINLNASDIQLASANVTVTGQMTGVETYEDSRVIISCKNNILHVESPYNEIVEVYNMTGLQLIRKEKPVGKIMINVPISNQVFIVKGSNGWVSKIVVN